MKHSNDIQFITGVLIWIGLIAGGVVFFRQSTSTSPVAARQIIDYLGAQKRTLEIVAPSEIVLGVGDPVFLETSSGQFEPIGVISELDFPRNDSQPPVELAWVNRATIEFVSGLPRLPQQAHVEYHEADASLGWVGKTMLSPSKRKELTELIVGAYASHQDDLLETFQPLISQTIADSAKIIRAEVALEISSHQAQIQSISRRYQSEVLEKDILPILQEEIWPIIQEESQPLVQMIGMEIWREVSVWRFGWRYLYDAAPLPDKNLAKKEFDRFLQKKAVPILETHLADAVELQKVILARTAKSEKLKKTLTQAGKKLFNDDEVKALVKEIFNNAIVDNQKLKHSIETTWRSDSAVAAMRIANDRLQPTVTEIGKALFGSPTTGVTPEFAQVLRNRVLHKDKRWLILKSPSSADQPMHNGMEALPVRISTSDSKIPYFSSAGGDE